MQFEWELEGGSKPESFDHYLQWAGETHCMHPVCIVNNIYKHVGFGIRNFERAFGKGQITSITVMIANSLLGGLIYSFLVKNREFLPFKLVILSTENMYMITLESPATVLGYWDILHGVLYNGLYDYGLEHTRNFMKQIHSTLGQVTYQKISKWHGIFNKMRQQFTEPNRTGVCRTQDDAYLPVIALKNLGFVQFHQGNSTTTKSIMDLFVIKNEEDEKMISFTKQFIHVNMFQ